MANTDQNENGIDLPPNLVRTTGIAGLFKRLHLFLMNKLVCRKRESDSFSARDHVLSHAGYEEFPLAEFNQRQMKNDFEDIEWTE